MTTQPRYPSLKLALLATAQFIIAVDYNIVYVALPSIGAPLARAAMRPVRCSPVLAPVLSDC